MTIRCNRIFSIPLRVCGKVVILQRETQIGFCMDLLRIHMKRVDRLRHGLTTRFFYVL